MKRVLISAALRQACFGLVAVALSLPLLWALHRRVGVDAPSTGSVFLLGASVVLAFVLVGVPLGTRSQQRGGGGGALGLSFVVLLLYYVVWTWAATLGRAGVVNPLLMAYLSFGLVTTIGVFLVWGQAR